MKRFTLIVEYVSGTMAMLVDDPDLSKALKLFEEARLKQFSESNRQFKDFELPQIISARIVPLMYESIYGDK